MIALYKVSKCCQEISCLTIGKITLTPHILKFLFCLQLNNISSRDANDSMSTNTASGAKESRVRDWDFFWARRHAFQFGALVTESPHPRTVGLAALSRGSRAELEAAYAALRDVDDAHSSVWRTTSANGASCATFCATCCARLSGSRMWPQTWKELSV